MVRRVALAGSVAAVAAAALLGWSRGRSSRQAPAGSARGQVEDACGVEARRRQHVAKRAELAGLIGDARARPGPTLAGTPDEVRHQARRLNDVARIHVAHELDDAGARALAIGFGWIDPTNPGTCDPVPGDPCSCAGPRDDRDVCAELAGRLVAAWGPPASSDDGVDSWIDETGTYRASLDTICKLVFERVPAGR